MTTYLLDSNVVIRWLNNEKLSQEAYKALSDLNSKIYISSINFFEIELKRTLGRLKIPDKYVYILKQSQFTFLDLTYNHTLEAANLPLHHKDPFDRFLIAQARIEKAILITSDSIIDLYDVKVLDA